MAGVQRARSRMGVEGLRAIMARAMIMSHCRHKSTDEGDHQHRSHEWRLDTFLYVFFLSLPVLPASTECAFGFHPAGFRTDDPLWELGEPRIRPFSDFPRQNPQQGPAPIHPCRICLRKSKTCQDGEPLLGEVCQVLRLLDLGVDIPAV